MPARYTPEDDNQFDGRLESDVEHLAVSVERLAKIVIDDGASSIVTRLTLVEKALSVVKSTANKHKLADEAEFKDLSQRLEDLKDAVQALSGEINAIKRESTALVESRKDLKEVGIEAIKGPWIFAAAIGTALVSAISAFLAMVLKAKFGG